MNKKSILIIGILLTSASSIFVLVKKQIDRIIRIESNQQIIINYLKNSNNSTDSSATSLESANNTYYGIDISKWNGDIVEEISAIDSISFVICKATEGIAIKDTKFDENWSLVKEENLICGVYHVYNASDDPKEQAEFFWKTIGSLDSTNMAPILNIGIESLPEPSSVNMFDLQMDVITFLGRLESLSDKIPFIHSNLSFANEYLSNDNFADYPLWLVDYTENPLPTVPKTWNEAGYKVWQKSKDYNMDSNHLDFDVFIGEKSSLIK